MADIDLTLLNRLCHLPGRGAGTVGEGVARDILTERLEAQGWTVARQPFRMPVHYIATLWWILGALIVGLLILPPAPPLGLLLCLAGSVAGFLFLDWRASPASFLPPSTTAENLIVSSDPQPQTDENILVIMAHYDSAPISLAYHPKLVGGFRLSVRIALVLMGLSVLLAAIYWVGWRDGVAETARRLLIVYFVVQGLVGSIDFWRYGYTQGANDNASGAVAAIALAERLRQQPLPDTRIELVLTSGEEHGMLGAQAYLRKRCQNADPRHFLLVNLDTVGRGQLRIVEETGTVTRTAYDNRLTRRARTLVLSESRYRDIRPIRHRVADFDTVWFSRAGLPCLTLAAYDESGLMPDIHRPEDTLEKIDPAVMTLTVDFAEDVLRHMHEPGNAAADAETT